MPGRFAETLDHGPQDNWIFFSQLSPRRTTGFFFTVVGLDDLDIFFLGRIPTLARARLEASMPGRWCGRASMPGRNALGIEAGRAIKRGWASPYSLGEPVSGEPSNEVGASHQTRLGEPVGRASTQLSRPPRLLQSCACLARCLQCLLGTST